MSEEVSAQKKNKPTFRPKLTLYEKMELDGWALLNSELENFLRDWLAERVSETIQDCFADGEAYFYFPVEYAPDSDGRDGACPEDPLTVYFMSGDHLVASFSLGEAIRRNLQMRDRYDPPFQPGYPSLSRELRKLADEIDAAARIVEPPMKER